MALVVSADQFDCFLASVCALTNVTSCGSIHRDEHDVAYQIKHNGEFVTVGRYTPPNEYLIFDVLGVNKTPKHTTQNGNM